jgi:hypothetical protein
MHMFQSTLVRAVSTLALLGVSAGFAGCSSTPTMQSMDLQENVRGSADKLEEGASVLQNTLIPLRQILDSQTTDVAKSYSAFSSSVDSFEDVADDLRELAETRKDQAAAYLVDSDEQISGIQDQKLREESRSRRRDVAARATALNAEYDQVRDELGTVTTGLNDMRKALAVDLSAAGIDAIRGPAKTITGKIEELVVKLNKLAAEHRKLATELGSSWHA